MPLQKDLLNKLTQFRRQLHRFPELSGNESTTSKTIIDFIAPTNPSEVVTDIGGHGVAFIYNGNNAGPTVLLRADMDALPIQESNSFSYKSTVKGVAHLCGHDGHSAILAGVAHSLGQSPISKGRLVLLFQPAEETGQGAAAVIADPKFEHIKPDYAFALHNLPGLKKGEIFLRNSTFASASTGLVANIKGLSSHAAHPEDGNNPDKALAQMILGLNYIARDKEAFNDFALLTVIHAKLGEVAFGTTPGNATLMATLRTYLDSDMSTLKKMVENHISSVCKEHKLKHSVAYVEEFPATINNEECVDLIKTAATELGLGNQFLENPFRWSEDFGHFTQISKAALFGVGSGVNHPQLHNEDYDFPDEIIEPSVSVFLQIVKKLLT
ncbi:MAG: amidohydrolase [Bacteroidales bacterium]